MIPSTAFEAWKNFILVLAGVLAGEMLTSFWENDSFLASVRHALYYFLDFDKWLARSTEVRYLAWAITILVVIYFLKCIHGIIVTIFSDEYYRHLSSNAWWAMLSCGLATLTVVSMTFVPFFTNIASNQRTISRAGLALVAMVAVPTYIFVSFDLFRCKFDWAAIKRFGSHVRHLFRREKNFEEVVGTWVVEDAISVLLLVIWLLVMELPFIDDSTRIEMTVVILLIFLLVNSVFDYAANRCFFFGFIMPKDDGCREGGIEATETKADVPPVIVQEAPVTPPSKPEG